MANTNPQRIVGYGLNQALPNIFPSPIIAQRIPNTSDKAQFGQMWVYKPGNAVYVLTSIVNNSATWTLLSNSGGAGVFTSLTVNPGPTAITGAFTLTSGALNDAHIADDASNHDTFVGTNFGSSLTTISGGGVGGGLLLQTANTGSITIGTTGMTGDIQLGVSTTGQNVYISPLATTLAQTVNIATGASTANNTVNILTGNATGGTQQLNVLTGTRAGTIALGYASTNNQVFIGGTGSSAHARIQGGNAANIDLNSGAITISSDSIAGINMNSISGGNPITIGSAGMTGQITLGFSSVGQNISIGDGDNFGGQIIGIANGNPSATSIVNILCGTADIAGRQTLNMMNGGTAGLVNIGTGVADNIINIGVSTGGGTGTTTMRSGSGGVIIYPEDTGPVTVGLNTSTGTFSFGISDAGQIVNVGTGAGANTVNIGTTAAGASTIIAGGNAGIFMNAPFVRLPNSIHVYTGAGAPGAGLALQAGDFYINSTPTMATDRVFVATGVGTWTNLVAAA